MSDRSVRKVAISRDLWDQEPETALRLLREEIDAKPADVWVIVLGPISAANQLFGWEYGPPEPAITLEDVG